MATHARVLPHLFTRNPGITSKALLATRGVNIRSRHYTDVAQQSGTLDAGENVPVDVPDVRQGWLFVDSVFPIRLGSWDFRHYIGIFREETLLARLSSILSSVKTHNFQVVSLEPHQKDGGVFVQFTYSAGDPASALKSLQKALREEAGKHGGMPSWIGMAKGDAWLVKGTPWREDMHRFASPIVKLAFEGPDIHEESVYDILRPYGQIEDLTAPTPVPAGSLRSTTITFRRLRSATIARNVVHGFASGTTRMHTSYQYPIQAHAIRDWLSSHPRIVLPVVVFLLGTLTYTIFDPIRSIMVEGKMLDWFDFRQYTAYKWVRANTLDRFDFRTKDVSPTEDVWQERKDAEMAVRNYLSDIPNTVAFVHGPQGSGKTEMMNSILKDTERKALVIDCGELHKATSDSALVAGLAQQTGYWPVFTFLNSMNNLIDLASVGLIGQKVGLSNSLTEQLKDILEVVGTGLTSVSSSHRKAAEHKLKEQQREEERIAAETSRRERIRNGTWHDGRLDCVAGNGVMSELGFGDELMGDADMESQVHEEGDEITREKEALTKQQSDDERERKERSIRDGEAISGLPIVIIRNYAAKGGVNREELLNVLASWAASLVENQVAHVVVVSDNRENSKRLAKALPSKPLNSIALYDADAASALSFVTKKLKDAGIDQSFTSEETSYVERLGGRSSDLDSLIHKVRSGQGVKEAVEDIINRGVGELRKNAFGDDAEDAKSLEWTREQAWIVLKQLSKQNEIPYHDLLIEFPFKGDESPLRSMEHAELISIGTNNGRPSIIRPGKPIFKYVFEQLVNDPIFRATQDIAFNDKVIAASESKIRACEEELMTLKSIGAADSSWWGGKRASSERAAYLFSKMLDAERKIEKLDKQTTELKKILAKGG